MKFHAKISVVKHSLTTFVLNNDFTDCDDLHVEHRDKYILMNNFQGFYFTILSSSLDKKFQK